MTSKELVYKTLAFENLNGRVPRQLWHLPWANIHHPEELKEIVHSFVWDFDGPPCIYKDSPIETGDPYTVGEYTDMWGCTFVNIQPGIIGEVKNPIITDDDWSDCGNIHIPDELLTFDRDTVNRYCEKNDKFIMASCCPRPFEQLQFIRGTAELYMDLITSPPKMIEFMKRMHEHYCKLFDAWGRTDVDGLSFMDDWGSQNSLLISPDMWVEIFKPMYKDLIDIAKLHGKKTFMHSDGNTISIIPHLIDLGLDALNTQIFCIGVEKLAEFKGKITFWGEIDRQHLLPEGTAEDIDNAVDLVFNTLWDNGGCIAQCEFGPMAKPANVRRTFERWSEKRL